MGIVWEFGHLPISFQTMLSFCLSTLPFFLLGSLATILCPQPGLGRALVLVTGSFFLWRSLNRTSSLGPRHGLVAPAALLWAPCHVSQPQPRPALPHVSGFTTISATVDGFRVLEIPRDHDDSIPRSRLWRLREITWQEREVQIETVHGLIRDDGDVEAGQRLMLFGWLRLEDERWTMDAIIHQKPPPDFFSLRQLGASWRRRARRHLERISQGATCRTLMALVLGRRELEREERDRVRRAGASHLFAVSGLHMILLSGMTAFVLRLLRIHGRLQWLLTSLAAIAYGLLTGLEPPVARALMALLLVMLARLSQRPMSTSLALMIVATAELLRDPTLLRDLSFQLSYSAVAGILVFGPGTGRKRELDPLELFLRRRGIIGRWDGLFQSVQLTAAALIATAPVTLYHFGTFAPVSLLSSLALYPVIALLLSLTMISFALPLPEFLLPALNNVLALAMDGAAAVPGGFLETGPPPAWALSTAGLLLLLGAVQRKKWGPHSLALAALGIPILLVSAACSLSPCHIRPRGSDAGFPVRGVRSGELVTFRNVETLEGVLWREPLQWSREPLTLVRDRQGVLMMEGSWQGQPFTHFGRMGHEAVLEYLKTPRARGGLVVLPRGGADTLSTQAILRALTPDLVVCHRKFEESLTLALNAGCRTRNRLP